MLLSLLAGRLTHFYNNWALPDKSKALCIICVYLRVLHKQTPRCLHWPAEPEVNQTCLLPGQSFPACCKPRGASLNRTLESHSSKMPFPALQPGWGFGSDISYQIKETGRAPVASFRGRWLCWLWAPSWYLAGQAQGLGPSQSCGGLICGAGTRCLEMVLTEWFPLSQAGCEFQGRDQV